MATPEFGQDQKPALPPENHSELNLTEEFKALLLEQQDYRRSVELVLGKVVSLLSEKPEFSGAALCLYDQLIISAEASQDLIKQLESLPTGTPTTPTLTSKEEIIFFPEETPLNQKEALILPEDEPDREEEKPFFQEERTDSQEPAVKLNLQALTDQKKTVFLKPESFSQEELRELGGLISELPEEIQEKALALLQLGKEGKVGTSFFAEIWGFSYLSTRKWIKRICSQREDLEMPSLGKGNQFAVSPEAAIKILKEKEENPPIKSRKKKL